MLAQTSSVAQLGQPQARVRYRILGFDRLNFVSDLADAVPQDGSCRISDLCFEADGLQVNGLLTVQLQTPGPMPLIRQRLRAVRGVVRVEEIQ